MRHRTIRLPEARDVASFKSYTESGNDITLLIGPADATGSRQLSQFSMCKSSRETSQRVALLQFVVDVSSLHVCNLPTCHQVAKNRKRLPRISSLPECRQHPAALGESRHVRSTLALKFLAATTIRVDRRNLDLTVMTSTVLVSLMVIERRDLEVQRVSEDHRACDFLSHDKFPCSNRHLQIQLNGQI